MTHIQDPADEAMVARAHERFAAERRRTKRTRRTSGAGALPNLIVIGGLKCGTTSLHHYLNLHPEIGMSRPKELNFFVSELNWELGAGWYRGHFPAECAIRGETSPHYTNRPRFEGVAERMREMLGDDARFVYMVRHPIDRLLSHYLHNVSGGYETRSLEEAASDFGSAYVQRSRYAFQLEPYLEAFGPDRVLVVTREELGRDRDATVRRTFEFCGVEAGFTSPEFDREWETGSGKGAGGYRLMDRAVRMPGLRTLDRNFDRLPERMRWLVERFVHDPESGEAAKPELAPELRERLAAIFRPDSERLEALLGRKLGWKL
ncbi:MAG: sulfotransferase [Actinomycetota bacterium]|nr:sulfotransferase [Actinomycetota bacterium]